MIIVFCGIPGSGKTTIAKMLSQILANVGRAKLIVSDEIARRVYPRIFKLLIEHINTIDYILLDATFYKKEWRDMVEAIAGKNNVLTVNMLCSLFFKDLPCEKQTKKPLSP